MSSAPGGSIVTESAEKIVAIIPARGGSKGLPGKNLLTVGGESLIARAVHSARACGSISRTVVSTDDPHIALAAEAAGAEIVIRGAALATDEASSESAILDALDQLLRRHGADPGVTVFLQCTAPLLEPSDIEGTLEALRAEQADSALAVCPSHSFLWTRNEAREAIGVNHDPRVRLRRQERAEEFLEAGSVYAFRTEGFRRARHRFFGRVALHAVPARRCIEVDDADDLALADWKAGTSDRGSRTQAPAPFGGLVFDFDGVFTDNRVWTSQDGAEAVCCNRSDGLAVERLRAAGIPMVVISKERNPVVAARCEKLKLECLQGVDDKLQTLRSWAAQGGRDLASLIYVGNDANDVECLSAVGLGVAVADAWPEAVRAAKMTLRRRGGDGAVKELSEWLLESLERSC